MKTIKYTLFTILTLLYFTSYSQNQEIGFLHDTLKIEKSDSIYYQTGNDTTGELKYGSHWYYRIVKIDSGFICQIRSFGADGQISSESNFSKGKLHGTYKNWDYKGSLLESGHYLHGFADSIWTFYNEYGIIESEGMFLPDSNDLIENFVIQTKQLDEWGDLMIMEISMNSTPHGKWKFYDSKGHQIKVLEFNKGVIKSMKFGRW